MLKNTLLICSTLVAFVLLPGQTAQGQIAIGIKAGTAGFGGEFTKSINEKFNARVSGTFFSYKTDGVYEDDPDIAYDVSNNITSIGLVADYFPMQNGLKLSAGLFYHDFLIDGGATPNESYELNDEKTFEPDRLGSLSGEVTYDSKIVPYAGLGFGNSVANGSKIRFNVELGAMYVNSPSVNMSGDGMIAPTANYGPDFQDGLKDFKFYPVINLGLSYRIN